MSSDDIETSRVIHAVDDTREPIPQIKTVNAGRHLVVAHHQDYTISRLPTAMRMKRLHEFHRLDDFAAWLRRHARESSAEILMNEMGASALLDAEDPDTDVISCKLPKHPNFAAWHAAVFGKVLTQKQFHALVRAQRETLADPTLLEQLAVFAVATEGKMQVELDVTGYTRFVGGDERKNVTGRIPPEIIVTVPVFEGITRALPPGDPPDEYAYDLELLVSLEIGDGAPLFTITCPRLPLVMTEALRDAVEFLGRKLGDGFLVGAGALRSAITPDNRA